MHKIWMLFKTTYDIFFLVKLLTKKVLPFYSCIKKVLRFIFVYISVGEPFLTFDSLPDVDECKEKLACQCPGCKCKNTWGSYECSCGGGSLYMREHDTCIGEYPCCL